MSTIEQLKRLWSQRAAARRERHRQPRGSARSLSMPPRLEQLEDRCLPSSWIPIEETPIVDPNGLMENGAKGSSYTGRISALAFAQTDATHETLFLGAASGGVWRSTDFPGNALTNTWTPLTDNAVTVDTATGLGAGAIDVGCITVDPNNPQVVYVGTGEANQGGTPRYGTGVLVSTDGGNSFRLLTAGPTGFSGEPAFFGHAISKIIVDPRNSNVLYVAVTNASVSSAAAAGNGPTSYGDDNGIYKITMGNAGLTVTKLAGAVAQNPPQIGHAIQVTDLDYTWAPSTPRSPSRLTLYAGLSDREKMVSVLFSAARGPPKIELTPFSPSPRRGRARRLAHAAGHGEAGGVAEESRPARQVTPASGGVGAIGRRGQIL